MTSDNTGRDVRVTDVQMPFGSMVLFMVKWAIASIPALVILVGLGVALSGVAAALFTSISAPRRQPANAAAPAASGSASPERAAYLGKVLVRNVSVSKSVLGQPGAFGEVKNTGDRTLKEVEITIYCLGSDGKPIFEKTYHPVLASELAFGDSGQPLKPGYARQFGVKLDDAPSDWNKRVDVKVTGVEFE